MSDETCCIVSLVRYPEKKVPPVWEDALILRENLGIEGDHHADGGERQISLLTVQEKEWMQKQQKNGFCFKKYKENILLDGICLGECRPGDMLKCGDVILTLTGSMKICHTEFCNFPFKEECPLPGRCRFARVKKGGIIRTGMKFSVVRENVK